MKVITKKQFSELWLNEFLGKNGLCLLCNNSGFISTRDGDKHCICPNGRTIKKQTEHL